MMKTLEEEIVVKPNSEDEKNERDIAGFIDNKVKIVGLNMVKAESL